MQPCFDIAASLCELMGGMAGLQPLNLRSCTMRVVWNCTGKQTMTAATPMVLVAFGLCAAGEVKPKCGADLRADTRCDEGLMHVSLGT